MRQSYSFESDSAEQTEALAVAIGRRLKGGEVIELRSDLGGGKTTFVRGLAQGMDSPDHVASPTFTVSREYSARDELVLHHYDFYRLGGDAGIMADELAEVLEDDKAVVAVEWSEAVAHVLPHDHIVISIERIGEASRRITASYPPAAEHLFAGVTV